MSHSLRDQIAINAPPAPAWFKPKLDRDAPKMPKDWVKWWDFRPSSRSLEWRFSEEMSEWRTYVAKRKLEQWPWYYADMVMEARDR